MMDRTESPKSAVVVGGSNGIGLAISNKLLSKGYQVHILDIVAPECALLHNGEYVYHYCNLRYLDEELILGLQEIGRASCRERV